MTAVGAKKVEEEFTQAKNNWELEKLYVDLASAKGKALTPVEKKFLRGLLCGFSPAEIANTVYQSRSSSTVRVYLSNGLYKYIEEMLSSQTGYCIKVKNWSRVTHLLEKAGYKKVWFLEKPQENDQTIAVENEKELDKTTIKLTPKEDWGEASDINIFYGRQVELLQVEKWIFTENCRLISILGMVGVGKTAFSVKLAKDIKDKFQYVIWRSLHLAPPVENILEQIMQVLQPEQAVEGNRTVTQNISRLIECLRTSRCLIVLDNIDAILFNEYTDTREIASPLSNLGDNFAYTLPQIQYRPGYEGYGELIRRVGETQHQSCLLLTSREKFPEIIALEGVLFPVRCLKLSGLPHRESGELLKAKGLTIEQKTDSSLLMNWYSGNPLFLKLVATTIQELFDGNIHDFLQQNIIVFGDIRTNLNQQFSRLSKLEKLVIYWLMFNRNLMSLPQIQNGLLPEVPQRLILGAIELLTRRSLIEKQAGQFFQPPVLMEYMAEQLIEEHFKLGQEKTQPLLISPLLLEALFKNYIRSIGTRAVK